MKYEIETPKKFKKQLKKLSPQNSNLVLEVIENNKSCYGLINSADFYIEFI